MLQSFLVCLAGMALLWWTLVRFELDAKASNADLGRLRRALDPTASPIPSGGRIAPVAATVTEARASDPAGGGG
jgi:hypothetical protein